MSRQDFTPQVRSPWRLFLGVLCIALVMLCGTLSVAHTHSDWRTHADCGLCVAAHAVVHNIAPVAPSLTALVFVLLDPPSLPPLRARKPLKSGLFTRPPPAGALS